MSVFSLWQSTKRESDLTRALQDRSYTQKHMGFNITSVNALGTYHYYFGVIHRDGLVARAFHVIPAQALASDPTLTNYMTFQPFWSVLVSGVSTQKFLGTKRSTGTLALVADVPLRMHEETDIGIPIPEGALLGVEVVVVGTPGTKRLGFSASVSYGG